MATIPTNPSDGDTFTDGVGVTWTYNSSSNKWLIPLATAGGGGGSVSATFPSAIPTQTTVTNTTAGHVLITGTGNGQFFHARARSNSNSGTSDSPRAPELTNTSGNSYFVETGSSYGAQNGLYGFSYYQGFIASGDTLTGITAFASSDVWTINTWDA